MEIIAILVGLVFIGGLLVLPIVAIVRTGRIRELLDRVAALEARLRWMESHQAPPPPPPVVVQPVPEPQLQTPIAPPAPQPQPTFDQPPPPVILPPSPPREHLEQIIGRRWLPVVAILLIVVAASFILKYAFENRWIGELGRVTLGVIAGLAFVWMGHQRRGHRVRYFSQVLISGGVTILYLSVYSAFGYYHLVDQRTAFVVLAILVVEAHLLAMAYDAPLIAVLALIGGFLVPILLSTGRDNYTVLFTYVGLLDLGVLGVVLSRSWQAIGSLAYVATQVMFWGWYTEHYHPEKRFAALLFQTLVFLIFAAADLAPALRRRVSGWEESIRTAVNPFAFFAICYSLLNTEYHDWMAALALILALLYAAVARAQLALAPEDRRILLVTVATALTFVTIAIPIQLNANWITIAWGFEGLVLLWVSLQTPSEPLRYLARVVFLLALARFLFIDTPWMSRPPFTPVFNQYFLGMLALAACLGGAAYLYRESGAALPIGLLAFGVIWLGSSFEAYTYFTSQIRGLPVDENLSEVTRRLNWSGQLALSLLWSTYAAALTATGFRWQWRLLRSTGLGLFGITLVKVLTVDMGELREFYRILALLILGLVLLGVAWKYQRNLRREQRP